MSSSEPPFLALGLFEEPRFTKVGELLRHLHLEKFAPLFLENEVDDDALDLLSEESVKELKLPLGARIKLLAYLKQNNSKLAASTEAQSQSVPARAVDSDSEDSVTSLPEEDKDHPKSSPSKSTSTETAPPQPSDPEPKPSIPAPSPSVATTNSEPSAPAGPPAPPQPPTAPAGIFRRIGRMLWLALYYICIFPIVQLYRVASFITNRILMPVSPLLVALPTLSPMWAYYAKALMDDFQTGNLDPVFTTASLMFLLGSVLALIAVQVVMIMWYFWPHLLIGESSKNSTSNGKEITPVETEKTSEAKKKD